MTFREVLFKKDFFCLWSGQIISEFGDRLNQMALIALVYAKYPGSVVALARLIIFIIIPVFIIGPVAGVYVDRWDRKRVMIISDIFRSVAAIGIPIFVYMDMMVPVYIMVFLIFSATRFFLPSKMALIPLIVKKEKLLVANLLSNTTRMIATVTGFAAAGFLVQLVGHMWGFYINSASYLVSAFLIGFITPKGALKNIRGGLHATRQIVERSLRESILSDLAEGFKHLFKKNDMKIVTGMLFILMGGMGSIFCVIIVFIQDSFGTVTRDLGIFGIFLAVGLFIGTVLYGKCAGGFSKIRTMFWSLALTGTGMALFTVIAEEGVGLAVTGLVIIALGAAASPLLTCAQTLVHMLVPDEARGRIFSSIEAVIHLAFIIMMLLTAHLSKYVSNFSILLASSIVFFILGSGGFFYLKGKRDII